jgi:UDP-GlcNAc:undecaprenyl-phosphate GlcNAc-1-phosphate transferase
VLLKAGVMIELVFLPPVVAALLSALWLLAAINAFNLIDIMDGLSSGVGALAALFFAGIAFAGGLADTAFLGAALAGGLLGFRYFNTFPARIYLGDTGSMFTGLLLGALAMVNDYTDVHALGSLVPLLVLGVPLFDMLFVMYVRYRRGLPVMLGSPDHVALRLRKWRLSTPATVRVNLAASALLGSAGVAVMLLPVAAAIAVLAGVGVLLLGVGIWLRTIDMSM